MENSQQERDGLAFQLDWIIEDLDYAARNKIVISDEQLNVLRNLKKEINNWEPEEVTCTNCSKLEDLEYFTFDELAVQMFEDDIDPKTATTREILENVLGIIQDNIGV